MKSLVRKHFQKADPILYRELCRFEGQVDSLTPRVTHDYFSDLCEAIINQQLSEKAGMTIFGRFRKLFPEGTITPSRVSQLPQASIRSIGVSWSKVRFIQDLAQKVIGEEIHLELLKDLGDSEVIAQLTRIRGIGPWTAEMFLMFSLGREDVFSFGDLGLKRAIQKLYKFKREPTRRQMEKIVVKWAPYKTYACRILWRSLDG